MENKRLYSLGVFLNIFDRDKKKWDTQASFIQSLGNVEHIEVLLEDISLSDLDIEYLQNILKSYRVIIHAPFIDLTLLSPHLEITYATLEVFRKALKISEKLKAELFTLHLQSYPFFQKEKDIFAQLSKNLITLAESTTMPISIENLSISGGATTKMYPSKPEDLESLTKYLPPKSGFTIDTGHFLKDSFDVMDVIEKHSKQILNFHLHDGDSKGAHYQLGNGNLPLRDFINLLQVKKYAKFVTLEVVGEAKIKESWDILQRLMSC